MKHLLYIFLFFVVLLSSCETTSSENGELDNMWYLTTVDSLSNGKTVDYRPKRIFWSFQGTLMQTNCVDSMNQFYMYRFEKKDGQLIVKSPFKYDRVTDDCMITEETLDIIRLYGVNSLTDTFKIEAIGNSRMVLKDNRLRLHFEKY